MRCEVHEGVEALGACARCGRGACAECAGQSTFTGELKCAKCKRPSAIAYMVAAPPPVPALTPPSMMMLGFAGALISAIAAFSHVGVFLLSAGFYGAISSSLLLPGTAIGVAVGLCLMAAGTRALRISLASRAGRLIVLMAVALACAFPLLLWMALWWLYSSHAVLFFAQAAYGIAGGALILAGGALVMLPRHAPAQVTTHAAFILLAVGGGLVASGLLNPLSFGEFLLFGGWTVAGIGLLIAGRVFLVAGVRGM